MKAEVISACQMFLVPMTILFAALGLARTEQLKTLISVLAFASSLVWVYASIQWPKLEPVDRHAFVALAAIFSLAWFISSCAHFARWVTGQEEKTPPHRIIVEGQIPPKNP